ncbi:ribosomal protein L4/L1 family-domain-containing protein [Umbelopsis sp. PMI_123]|nr:ribosomal protein L4/L1 family-domain-containing protein [Umbelopsis sp. PMI_123]
MSFIKQLGLTSRLPSTVARSLLAPQQRLMASYATESPVAPITQPVQSFLRKFDTNEPLSIIELERSVFGAPIRRDILQRVVVWQRDNMRQGTQSTKGRADVRGTSKKAAQQKGRGKARVGSMRAPHFRGGGIAFGPKPRDHSTDLPNKVQLMGLRVALSAKYAQDQLVVVDSFKALKTPKTKELQRILDTAHADKSSILIMANYPDEKLEMAAGNLSRCGVLGLDEINVLSLLKFDKLVIEKEALDELVALLKN